MLYLYLLYILTIDFYGIQLLQIKLTHLIFKSWCSFKWLCLFIFFGILYIHCMLVREMWKFIHPIVLYSLRATPEEIMVLVGEYIFIFPEPACYKCFIIPNENKKTHTCKILLESIFGTLSQTFENHIHNKWCVPSASDVFLSKIDNSGGKTREASKVVEYDVCPV